MEHPPKPNEPPSDSPLARTGLPSARRSDLADPLQIGVTIVGTTAVVGGIGWWLDSFFGTFPILMAIGAASGLFGIIYLTYIRLQEADRRARKAEQDEHSTRPGEKT
ncbi:AtpZ/AtpI family protein [bacterium]|nr:AtpZ/AtpI family protein [bacterium]MBU1983693.1 AtpZ/AtpI family protein [bacterium]